MAVSPFHMLVQLCPAIQNHGQYCRYPWDLGLVLAGQAQRNTKHQNPLDNWVERKCYILNAQPNVHRHLLSGAVCPVPSFDTTRLLLSLTSKQILTRRADEATGLLRSQQCWGLHHLAISKEPLFGQDGSCSWKLFKRAVAVWRFECHRSRAGRSSRVRNQTTMASLHCDESTHRNMSRAQRIYRTF